jgi:hypothetical protein
LPCRPGARPAVGLVLAVACWVAPCGVPLAFIDAEVRRLPDVLTGAAFAGSYLVLVLVSPTWFGARYKQAAGLALT